MRLLEYQVNKFLKDCIYSDIEEHECAEKGFKLSKLMNKGTEFWLTSKDCTDRDFVKAVYKEVTKLSNIPESELLEILTRFLCGYDVYEKFKDSRLEGKVDSKIENKDLTKKVQFIKDCIR